MKMRNISATAVGAVLVAIAVTILNAVPSATDAPGAAQADTYVPPSSSVADSPKGTPLPYPVQLNYHAAQGEVIGDCPENDTGWAQPDPTGPCYYTDEGREGILFPDGGLYLMSQSDPLGVVDNDNNPKTHEDGDEELTSDSDK